MASELHEYWCAILGLNQLAWMRVNVKPLIVATPCVAAGMSAVPTPKDSCCGRQSKALPFRVRNGVESVMAVEEWTASDVTSLNTATHISRTERGGVTT